MATHGTGEKSKTQRARHHGKASRAKRLARRWDERVNEMRADLERRAAAEQAASNSKQGA